LIAAIQDHSLFLTVLSEVVLNVPELSFAASVNVGLDCDMEISSRPDQCGAGKSKHPGKNDRFTPETSVSVQLERHPKAI
jgi:hypothetical protein